MKISVIHAGTASKEIIAAINLLAGQIANEASAKETVDVKNPRVPTTVKVTVPEGLVESLREFHPKDGVRIMQQAAKDSMHLADACRQKMQLGMYGHEDSILFGMAALAMVTAEAIAEAMSADAALADIGEALSKGTKPVDQQQKPAQQGKQ